MDTALGGGVTHHDVRSSPMTQDTTAVRVYVPKDGHPIDGGFWCPSCGSKVRVPFAGHKWHCHEDYGGCGAVYQPEKGFKRIE